MTTPCSFFGSRKARCIRAIFARGRVAGWLVALAIALGFGVIAPASAATVVPITSNLTYSANPELSATAIVNIHTIEQTLTPFQPQFMLSFTNAISGVLVGNAGVQLEFLTNNSSGFAIQAPAANIHNLGIIQGEDIYLRATNLINSGQIRMGGEYLILEGQNVNVSRSVLSATAVGFSSFAGVGYRLVNTNGSVTYINPNQVADIYWGAGTGNVMQGQSAGLSLTSLEFNARPPVVISPSHEVDSLGGLGIFFGSGRIAGTNFSSYVRTNVQGTNVDVQVVLLQTNIASSNLTVDVRFASLSGGQRGGANIAGATPLLRFSSTGSDITTGGTYTNSLYFADYLNTGSNSIMSLNTNASTSRPAAYEVSRDTFLDDYFSSAALGSYAFTNNTTIGNIVYYQAGFFDQATVTNNLYAAYRCAVGTAAFGPGSAYYVPQLDDPTNGTGRIQIVADNLNLGLSRIQADSLVSIRATNLITSAGTLIEAPFVQLDIANTNTTLTLTNFATAQVPRITGNISFYSTTWTNNLTNATPALTYRYHLLIVDAAQLDGLTPVTLQEFSARGTNVVINNALNIGRVIQVNSPAVTFNSSSSLILPSSVTTNLGSTNFPNVQYFTNNGVITVPNQCVLGSDRGSAISNLVNRGTITANNIDLQVVEFENSGTNLTRSLSSGVNAGVGGPISIRAGVAKLDGGSAGGLFSAGGSILLAANDIKLRNHRLVTGGTLVLAPTNSLTDTGEVGTNRIDVALGFSLNVKPAVGDLLGTTIYTTTTFNRDLPHTWAAEDRGAVPAGYTNNAALGRLLLDTTTVNSANRLSFYGTGASNAIYVDYLELQGTLTNDLPSDLTNHLFIETNMVIYFANANLPPDQLDGRVGGRLRWVKDFAGPNTGVDVRLPDGRTIKVNVGKLNSPVLDSDADGIVNASDLSPFDGVVIDSQVTFANVPPLTAYVRWEAAAQTVYRVEVNTNLLTGTWELLSTFANSSVTNRVVTFSEPVPAGGTERFYRISYLP